MPNKYILGFTEQISLVGVNKSIKLTARIDTGAARCSIDNKLAKEIGFKKVVRKKLIKSAQGNELRRIVFFRIKIMNKLYKVSFTLANRDHMKYKVLLGRNLLKTGDFIIDPSK